MATAVVAESRKLPRPGRGGVVSHGLSEEEARVRAIAEIVNNMVELSQGENVDLNALKSAACRKYGLSRAPNSTRLASPRLRAKPVRTASGIAVVAVMSKPHRCPHIATTGNICVYCPGGPDSDFEYSTQSYTGYEPTSMRAIRARYNPYVQARSRIDQPVEFILMGGTFMSLPAEYRDYFTRNLHDALSGHTSANVEEAVAYSEHSAIKFQSTHEDVARDTNRGHTVAAVADCFAWPRMLVSRPSSSIRGEMWLVGLRYLLHVTPTLCDVVTTIIIHIVGWIEYMCEICFTTWMWVHHSLIHKIIIKYLL
ncbi:hypothetical protein AAG906_011233 [Vitis piasezkii]